MNKQAILGLLVGFVGIAVFGFLGMHVDMESHENAGCIASMSQSAECPATTPADSSAFHVNAFKGFSLATFDHTFMTGLLLAFAFSFVTIASWLATYFLWSIPSVFDRDRPRTILTSLQKIVLTHWLALHENSPSFA